jgi:hypothetical protein
MLTTRPVAEIPPSKIQNAHSANPIATRVGISFRISHKTNDIFFLNRNDFDIFAYRKSARPPLCASNQKTSAIPWRTKKENRKRCSDGTQLVRFRNCKSRIRTSSAPAILSRRCKPRNVSQIALCHAGVSHAPMETGFGGLVRREASWRRCFRTFGLPSEC